MKRVFIVGGANIDIQGRSSHPIHSLDSNVGEIFYSYGGVGRNIAENLARLDVPVSLVTVFGDDPMAEGLKLYFEKTGIDLTYSLTIPHKNSSTYLAVLDEKSDLYVGMADMGILDCLTIEHLSHVLKHIHEEDLLVVDTNLSEKHITYLLQNAKCPVAMDPISSVKARKVKDLLSYLTFFKPNQYEAEELSQIPITDMESAKKNIEFFLQKGISEIIITLGEKGLIGAVNQKIFCYKPPLVSIVSATGAGDSWFAGYLEGKFHHRSIEETIKRACIISSITLQDEKAVSSDLSQKVIDEIELTYQLKEIQV